jgi:hypothetical protein
MYEKELKESYKLLLDAQDGAYAMGEAHVTAQALYEAVLHRAQGKYKDLAKQDRYAADAMVREDVKKERAKLLKAEKDLRKAQHELRKAMIQVDMLNKLVEAGRIADR